MKKNKDTIELYQFKDFDMDRFIELYLYEVNPHEEIDEETLSVYAHAKTKMTERKQGVRTEDKVRSKCMYLQDAIIRRAYSKRNNKTFSMRADLLRSVIGKEYRTMLMVLIEMEYIELGDGHGGTDKPTYYQTGKYSTIYTLRNVEVCKTELFYNAAIKKYKEKTVEGIKKLNDKYTYPYIIKAHGEPFLKRYLTSLDHIRIEDRGGLNAYIKEKVKDNINAEPYYHYVVNQLDKKDKDIFRIDVSGRVYHILTNLDRELKQYLNIDFSLDCKNSHPLLFNYFIFNKLKISSLSSFNISKSLSTLIPDKVYHNDGKYLRNILINNNIENNDVAKMSDDELEYVYMTSTGQLWDDICSRHPDLERSEVKVEMFKAVFYSHSPVADRWSDYAQDFKSRFPSVYRLIGDWKRELKKDEVTEYMAVHHLPIDRGSSSLSIAMMALEADIFTTILKRLYAKRWNAVHIHDCIVVPKDENRNHPTIEAVREIMSEVYREFGLAPTFD